MFVLYFCGICCVSSTGSLNGVSIVKLNSWIAILSVYVWGDNSSSAAAMVVHVCSINCC